jgi:uncharacterized phage-associated protein
MIYITALIFIIGLYLVTLQKQIVTKTLNKMYNCFDIADYLLKKAEDDGQGIDPMKLLKLTYIAHGYNLGFFEKPLFSNQVQAWKYGSVIPDLYHVIKRFGEGYVNKEIVDLYKEKEVKDDQKKLLDFVWNAYKPYSGLDLSDLTHQKGTPWDLTPKAQNSVINEEVIKKYYKSLIAEKREQQ